MNFKRESVFSDTVLFMLITGMSFTLMFAVFRCIWMFLKSENVILLRCIIVLFLIISVVIPVILIIMINKDKDGKIDYWIGNRLSHIVIGYCIMVWCLFSISDQLAWQKSEINGVITIEWMIFTISVTIFLIWYVLMASYLKRRQPISRETDDNLLRYVILLNKQTFSHEVEITYSRLVLITINLFLLVISTALVYICNLAENLHVQNLIRCSFFLTTNTIVSLFLDILKPIKDEKESMVRANAVTKQELDDAKTNAIVSSYVNDATSEMMEFDGFTEEQKECVIKSLSESIKKVYTDISEKK